MAMTSEEKRKYQRDWQRRWRAKNPERARANARRNYAANRKREQERARIRAAAIRETDEDYARRGRHRGLQAGELVRMFEAQQGRCYLCGDLLPGERRKWHIDHDHRCCPQPGKSCRDCRRGIACHNCNCVIGYALDDPERLRQIADRLETALAEVTRRLADKAVQGELFESSECGEVSWLPS